MILIEATPIPNLETDYLYGRIWVRESDFSILKIEWNQKSIINFDLIEEEAKRFNETPVIKFYTEYALDKNGIRFPSKYSITETYSRRAGGRETRSETYRRRMGGSYTRSKTTVVYKDYKFFTVKTEVKYK